MIPNNSINSSRNQLLEFTNHANDYIGIGIKIFIHIVKFWVIAKSGLVALWLNGLVAL